MFHFYKQNKLSKQNNTISQEPVFIFNVLFRISVQFILTYIYTRFFQKAIDLYFIFMLLSIIIALSIILISLPFKKKHLIIASLLLPLIIFAVKYLLLLTSVLFNNTTFLDLTILSIDENMLFMTIPFAWVSFSTYITTIQKKIIPIEVIINTVLLAFLLLTSHLLRIQIFSHPFYQILTTSIFIFLEFILLFLYRNTIIPTKMSQNIVALLTVILITGTTAYALLTFYAGDSLKNSGGLIKPTLFQFDFSDYLNLESEISLNNNLVMIVKKDKADSNIHLKRYSLSEYSKKTGFSMNEYDKKNISSLPNTKTKLKDPFYIGRKELIQEYFIVNFEKDVFFSMNYPLEINPYFPIEGSSFKSAYKVISKVPDEATKVIISFADLKNPKETYTYMTEEEFKIYTKHDKDLKIQNLARELTKDTDDYYQKIYSIYDYLKYNYYYSLKPGISKDSDQIHHFLFESKKGYCSYFAFSMTLLLRSLDIPARVAVGFFVNPETAVLDMYPVRSNMAHAWVEVFFDEYGWIEFDPTSETMAEGEEINFGNTEDEKSISNLFAELIKTKEAYTEVQSTKNTKQNTLIAKTNTFSFSTLALYLVFLCILLMSCYCISIRILYKLHCNNKKNLLSKITAQFYFILSLLHAIENKKEKSLSLFEYIHSLKIKDSSSIIELFTLYEKALYSTNFTREDSLKADKNFKLSKNCLIKQLPLYIKLLSIAKPLPLKGLSSKQKRTLL